MGTATRVMLVKVDSDGNVVGFAYRGYNGAIADINPKVFAEELTKRPENQPRFKRGDVISYRNQRVTGEGVNRRISTYEDGEYLVAHDSDDSGFVSVLLVRRDLYHDVFESKNLDITPGIAELVENFDHRDYRDTVLGLQREAKDMIDGKLIKRWNDACLDRIRANAHKVLVILNERIDDQYREELVADAEAGKSEETFNSEAGTLHARSISIPSLVAKVGELSAPIYNQSDFFTQIYSSVYEQVQKVTGHAVAHEAALEAWDVFLKSQITNEPAPVPFTKGQ